MTPAAGGGLPSGFGVRGCWIFVQGLDQFFCAQVDGCLFAYAVVPDHSAAGGEKANDFGGEQEHVGQGYYICGAVWEGQAGAVGQHSGGEGGVEAVQHFCGDVYGDDRLAPVSEVSGGVTGACSYLYAATAFRHSAPL